MKVQQALYYTAGKDRLLTIVLTRDTEGKRPDHRFYCTRLEWSAREILSAYASRWALEVTFEGAKQVLGLEDPANRLPKAVRRTAPMALVLYSLVVLWFDQVGHELLRVSGAAMVSAEERTIVPRYGEHAAAAELAGEISGGGVTKRPPQ